MTTDDRVPPKDVVPPEEGVPPKDVAPPEEGVIHPAEELVHLNDDAPTETGDPYDDEPTLDKRPTDGPM